MSLHIHTIRRLSIAIAASSVVLLGAPLPAAAQLATDLDCVPDGCVDKSDIAPASVDGQRLTPRLLIGKPYNDGRIALRKASGADALTFEAETGRVQVGRGGHAVNERADTDFYVYDPFCVGNETQASMWFDASSANMTLGSACAAGGEDGDLVLLDRDGRNAISMDGDNATAFIGNNGGGEAGELYLRNNLGQNTIGLFGGTGDIDLGRSGYDGDLRLKDNATGNNSVMLDGAAGFAILGTTSEDGDLHLRDSANVNTLTLDGATGDIFQKWSGDGVAKACCQITAAGGINAGRNFRCNTSTSETRKINTGVYEVDFTPVHTDIRSRFKLAQIDTHSNAVVTDRVIGIADRGGDTSSLYITTRNLSGTAVDTAFSVCLF